jgi:hypothetical protein
MEDLTEKCIEFVTSNIVTIAQTTLDLNCLSGKILKKIARKLDIMMIDDLQER